MITAITYNWHQASDGSDAGEDYYHFEVGKTYQGKKVTEITETLAHDGSK